jgi:hypothetical protein
MGVHPANSPSQPARNSSGIRVLCAGFLLVPWTRSPNDSYSVHNDSSVAMLALRRPALLGAGMVAATRPPAQWTAVRAGWSVRGRGGAGR